jgi:hypothetical protein
MPDLFVVGGRACVALGLGKRRHAAREIDCSGALGIDSLPGRWLPALRRWIIGCAVLIDRNDPPKHLFGIPDLDLSRDLSAEPLAGPWFRLGACSPGSVRDKHGVENVVYRQSMLLSPEDFSVIFDKLESFVGDIGRPGGSLIGDGDKRVYRCSRFHRFEISFTRAAGRWYSFGPAFLPQATCAPARSNAVPPQWARAAWRSRACTRSSGPMLSTSATAVVCRANPG